MIYPATVRVEGIAPSQYGTKGLLGEKFADVEEKYDLSQVGEGFTQEGEETENGEDIGLSEEAADEGTEEI